MDLHASADVAPTDPDDAWTAVAGRVALAVGVVIVLGLTGAPAVEFAGRSWRLLFGRMALPTALLVLAAGLGSVRRTTHGGGSGSPWPRVVGAEIVVASALALATLAWSPTGGAASTLPGGIVGRALARPASERFGPVPAAIGWFAGGVLGVILAVGPHRPRRSQRERRRLDKRRDRSVAEAAAVGGAADAGAREDAALDARTIAEGPAGSEAPSRRRARRLPPVETWDTDRGAGRAGPVGLGGILADPAFRRAGRPSRMALPIGRDTGGVVVTADLAALPHLLVAGSAGSGSREWLAALVCALAAQNTPESLRLVLVEPGRTVPSPFEGLPHLMACAARAGDEAVGALRWLSAELDGRRRRLAEARVPDLASLNASRARPREALPRIAVIVDDMADLMGQGTEEVEPRIARLAHLGPEAGIHLVLSAARPSMDVLTGPIQAGIRARAAFAVAGEAESRAVLGRPGAESLEGRGDMLYLAPGASGPRRLRGACASDGEIERLVAFWSDGGRRGPPPAPWRAMTDP